jgi:DNA recombination protein RmuC
MEILLIIVLAVLMIGFAGVFIYLKKYPPAGGEVKPKEDSAILLLQNQLHEITRRLDISKGEMSDTIQRQMSESNRLIREITQELTKVGEGQKQVFSIADQLKNLQDILKNPKQRGVLGEYFLETLLKNVMAPGQYQMQYKFKDGSIVDAVIFVKDKIIPIDSKFSLENYNRILEENDPTRHAELEKIFKQDLKNRIDETSKYIKPEEGTMEFAFMFIPAEGIYYDLLINKVGSIKSNTQDLIQYAFKDKKVVIVSPTSFLAYFQTILQGLKALQIEESAKEIRKRVENLGKHIGNYESFIKKLGSHLGTTVNMYNSAYKELGKIDKDVLKIAGESAGIEPEVLQLPEDIE